MTITETQNELIDEFSMFDDWMQRYEYMIEMGKSLEPLNPEFKTENKLIKGCQSQVWLHSEMEDGKVIFTADSDAIITKGIVAILVRVFSGHTPQEILNADTEFIDEIGLKEHLSPTRANGLVSMIKQMKLDAMAFQTQINSK